MKNFLKSFWLPLAAASVLCGACSKLETEETGGEGAAVTVSVRAAGFRAATESTRAGGPATESRATVATRAGSEGLSPVTLLVVPDGVDKIEKKITVADDGEFNVRLDNGTYDLVAVCGLDADLIGEDYSSAIAVPSGADFAVGATRVSVANGVCTPSSVSITADRQMAWLEVSVTGVPENVAKFDLFVKEPCDNYALDCGWGLSDAGKEKYAKVPLTKKDGGYSCSLVMVPCSSSAGVTYVAEATTMGGTKTTLTYTAKKPLAMSAHLTQTLAYGDLMIVEGGINVGGWNDSSDDGTLVVSPNGDSGNGSGNGSSSSAFVPGEALPGYPEATVVAVDGNVVTFVANEPLEGKATYFKNLPKKDNYAYPLSIPNTRWFIPQYSIEADRDMAEIFLALLLNNESARTRLGVTLDDTDVLAYINPDGSVSYFDFLNKGIMFSIASAQTYRCFVFGEMTVE